MYGNGQAPIFILKEGTQRTRGRSAQSNNIAAAKAVADSVRSTLGPKGMDKMLVDSMGDVVITNDGATILKEMDIEHPAAKMIIEVAKTQEQHCYDGTTSAVVLSGEFSSVLKILSNKMFIQPLFAKVSVLLLKRQFLCSRGMEFQQKGTMKFCLRWQKLPLLESQQALLKPSWQTFVYVQ